jgi:hypothetical protein
VFKLNGRLRLSRRAVDRFIEGDYPFTAPVLAGSLQPSI